MVQLAQLPTEILNLIAKLDARTAITLCGVSKRFYAIARPHRHIRLDGTKAKLKEFLCFTAERAHLWKQPLYVTIRRELEDSSESDDNKSFQNSEHANDGSEDDEDRLSKEELALLQKTALSIPELDPKWHTKLGENNYAAFVVLLLQLATKLEKLDLGAHWFSSQNFIQVNKYITKAVTEHNYQNTPLPPGLLSLKEYHTERGDTRNGGYKLADLFEVFELPNIEKFQGDWICGDETLEEREDDDMNDVITNGFNNPKPPHPRLSVSSRNRISSLKELHLTNSNISGNEMTMLLRFLKNIKVLRYGFGGEFVADMKFRGDAWGRALREIRETLEVLELRDIDYTPSIVGSLLLKDYPHLHTVILPLNYLVNFNPQHTHSSFSPLANELPPSLERLKLVLDYRWNERSELIKNSIIQFLERKNSDFPKLKELKLILVKIKNSLLTNPNLKAAIAEAKIEFGVISRYYV